MRLLEWLLSWISSRASKIPYKWNREAQIPLEIMMGFKFELHSRAESLSRYAPTSDCDLAQKKWNQSFLAQICETYPKFLQSLRELISLQLARTTRKVKEGNQKFIKDFEGVLIPPNLSILKRTVCILDSESPRYPFEPGASGCPPGRCVRRRLHAWPPESVRLPSSLWANWHLACGCAGLNSSWLSLAGPRTRKGCPSHMQCSEIWIKFFVGNSRNCD